MKIRVAVAGVGNSTSVFLQGLAHYRSRGISTGLWHKKVAGFSVRDIDVVAAYDVDSRKVGLDLSEAAFAKPNTVKRFAKLGKAGFNVEPGLAVGDVATYLSTVETKQSSPEDFVDSLKSRKADLLIALISSGSDASARAYAEASLAAGCHFVNCTPAPLAKDTKLSARFKRARLVIAGDDLMSQFGGTIFHKGLLKLMFKRGIRILRSYQLDVGGGTETLNTINEAVKLEKRAVKTGSISAEIPYQFRTVAGTTDYVDYMGNQRTSYFWVEGKGFLDSPVKIDVYLRTSDGPNGGNVILDVVRAVAGSPGRRVYGAVQGICGYGFKSPPKKMGYEEAYAEFSSGFVD